MNGYDWEVTGDPAELLQLRRMPCCGTLYTKSGGRLALCGDQEPAACTRCHAGIPGDRPHLAPARLRRRPHAAAGRRPGIPLRRGRLRRPDRRRETLATLRGRREACAYAEENFGVRSWGGDGPRSRWGDGLRKRTTPCALLASLRSPGPHYRGHHGLDVVLGRVPAFTPEVAT